MSFRFNGGFFFSITDHNNLSEYLLFSEQRIIPNTACIGFYGNDAELISNNVMCSMSVDTRQAACKGNEYF